MSTGLSLNECYAALQLTPLTPSAESVSSVKRRYRQMALKHHPDKGGDAERFKQIGLACEALCEVLSPEAVALPLREAGIGLEAAMLAMQRQRGIRRQSYPRGCTVHYRSTPEQLLLRFRRLQDPSYIPYVKAIFEYLSELATNPVVAHTWIYTHNALGGWDMIKPITHDGCVVSQRYWAGKDYGNWLYSLWWDLLHRMAGVLNAVEVQNIMERAIELYPRLAFDNPPTHHSMEGKGDMAELLLSVLRLQDWQEMVFGLRVQHGGVEMEVEMDVEMEVEIDEELDVEMEVEIEVEIEVEMEADRDRVSRHITAAWQALSKVFEALDTLWYDFQKPEIRVELWSMTPQDFATLMWATLKHVVLGVPSTEIEFFALAHKLAMQRSG